MRKTTTKQTNDPKKEIELAAKMIQYSRKHPYGILQPKANKTRMVVRTKNILITDDILIIIKFRDGSGMNIRKLPSEHGMRPARSSHQSSLENWANKDKDFWSQLQVPLSCLKEQKTVKQWSSWTGQKQYICKCFCWAPSCTLQWLKTNILHVLTKKVLPKKFWKSHWNFRILAWLEHDWLLLPLTVD